MMVPPTCADRTSMVTRCQHRGCARLGVSPKVNKFKKVFNDDHQMSQVGEGVPEVPYPGGGRAGDGAVEGIPVLRVPKHHG